MGPLGLKKDSQGIWTQFAGLEKRGEIGDFLEVSQKLNY